MSPADDATPVEVATALRLGLSRLFRRMRRPAPDGELTLPESAALADIARMAPTTAAALARREQMSAQSMGATLASLGRQGLVARTPDPDDGRRTLLSLTPDGVRRREDRRAAKTERLAQALEQHFTAPERARLLAAAPLLERLGDLL